VLYTNISPMFSKRQIFDKLDLNTRGLYSGEDGSQIVEFELKIPIPLHSGFLSRGGWGGELFERMLR
jgi:hypothetical protein